MHTILVVDDSKSIREFCRRELEKCSYRVLVAQDGREALDLCDQEAPDLIVLDVHMPGLDGLATNRELRARHRTIPVIFHTGTGPYPRLDHGDWRARAWVAKSHDLRELKSAIAFVLSKVRKLEEEL